MTKKKILAKGLSLSEALAELHADYLQFSSERGLPAQHGSILDRCASYCDAYNTGSRRVSDGLRLRWLSLHPKTFYNLMQRWKHADLESLKDGRTNDHARARGHFHMHPEHARIAERLIVGNRKLQQSDRWLHKLLCEALIQAGLEPLPSLKATRVFRSGYLEEHERDLFVMRAPDRAKGSIRPAVGSMSDSATRPNQIVELDFTPANVLGRDGRRAHIGTAIDVFTRRRVDLLVDRPNSDAVAEIIKRYITLHGVPACIRIDNGREFVNQRILLGAKAFRIDVDIMPPYSGDKKPFVERSHRTLADQVFPLLDSHIGRNVAERQAIREETVFARRGQEKAQLASKGLDRPDLQRLIDAWSVSYHNTAHSSLGCSPNEMAARHRGQWSRLDPEQLPLLALHFARPAGRGVATVGKEGLRVDGRDYAAPELFYPQLNGARVAVREHPTDAGALMVFTEEDSFLCVAWNPELAGIDRAELAARCRAHYETLRKGIASQQRALKRNGPTVQALAISHIEREARQFENVAVLANVERHEAPGLVAAQQAHDALTAQDAAAERERATPARAKPAFDFESEEMRTFSSDDDRLAFWGELHERIEAEQPVHPRHRAWYANNAEDYRPGYQALREFEARTAKKVSAA